VDAERAGGDQELKSMPLLRISFREGKSAQYRRAVVDEVHCALVEVAGVPELHRFQVLTEHAPADMSQKASG